MNRGILTKTEKRNRAVVMRRTYSIYKHMAERADDAKVGLPFSLVELRGLVDQALSIGGTCIYCRERLRPRTFSLDHALPVHRGGTWELANLDVICDPCNRAKGTMTSREFRVVLEALREMPDAVRRDVLGRLKAGAALRRLTLARRRAA